MSQAEPTIIYVDMDDVICDFAGAYNSALQQNPTMKHPQSQYGFFANLTPKEGAIEAIEALIQSPVFELYVLTAPSTRNPFSYTEKRVWIEKYFGYDFVEKLIICVNKSLLKGDYLIDDNTSGKGQEGFEGELLHFGGTQYPHWHLIRQSLNF